jgi:hypothetical protein
MLACWMTMCRFDGTIFRRKIVGDLGWVTIFREGSAARPRGQLGPCTVWHGTDKQPVFGIIERGGRVFTEIIEDTTKATLQGLIRGHVARDATVISDGWRS